MQITQSYYWRGMAKDTQEFCKSCDICQRVNRRLSKQRPELHPIPVTDIWNHIGVDLVGPLPITPRGNKFIITATDYFSKWPEAAALPDKTAIGVANFLFGLFCRHGWPKILSCDQGREFVNAVSCCLFDLTSVEQRISSAYHPQTNGLDERTNQTLVKALIKLSSSQEDWDLNIDSALYAYRIARHDSTGYSPFFLLYSRHPRKAIDYDLMDEDGADKATTSTTYDDTEEIMDRLIDIRQQYHDKAKLNIEKAQERQKKYYDAKYRQQVSFVAPDSSWCYITGLLWHDVIALLFSCLSSLPQNIIGLPISHKDT